MEREFLNSEVVKDKITKMTYSTNIIYGVVFKNVKSITNDILSESFSPIVSLNIFASETDQKTVFELQILDKVYEKNKEKYDNLLMLFIKENSLLRKHTGIDTKNIIEKIPSILEMVPKSKKEDIIKKLKTSTSNNIKNKP